MIKQTIDLADGAKILGKDEASAQVMIGYLVETLAEVRAELNAAHREYQLNHDAIKLTRVVEKFHEGLLYVGVPALRQSADDLLMALRNKEQDAISQLYQHTLNEMDMLEKMVETKVTAD